MNTKKQGIELGNLAKLMFDKAVILWYSAVFIEIFAGISAVIIGLLSFSDSLNIAFAVMGFLLLATAYYLKVRFNIIYDHGETMRRQSVLAIALDWQIATTQFSEWRMLAGEKILKTLDLKKEDPDYFATQQETGARKLLEMTQESAFWTRHLYCYLRNYIWIIFSVAVILFILLITFATTDFISHSISLKLVYVVYLLLPLVLTIDLLGWGIKLNQLICSIKQIEDDMERLSGEDNLNETKVLRLTSEYNCQVVSGIPIPGWFFGKHHDLVESLWKRR